MRRIPGTRFLHSPGPTHVPDEVLNAMHRQPMDHGDPRLDQVIAAIDKGIKQLLQTADADLYMFASNGHGAWEATIENLLAPGQTVLIPGSGHFSESWAVQTEALGRRVIRTPFREGHPIDANVLEQALRAVARERFQVAIAGGLGPQTGRAFRIGHLGSLNSAMILGCLAGVEAAMQVQGIPFGRGGMEMAIASLGE